MDLSVISAISSSLSSAMQLAKTINDGNTELEVKNKTLELQQLLFTMSGNMLNLQSEYIASIEENKILKQKLEDKESWHVIENQYEFYKFQDVNQYRVPSTVFKFKSNSENTIEHYLCPQCFNNKIKSVLQPSADYPGYREWHCHHCKNIIEEPLPHKSNVSFI